jgi:aminomethyltransferase
MSVSLAATPLHDWHKNHGARMAEFAGYEMPIQYTTIIAEHETTRKAAALFDISHMGRLRFDGPRAEELLDRLLTRRVKDMEIGQVRYSLVCNEQGGILDDVLVYCLESPSSRQYFLLVVNASNRPKIVNWITSQMGDFPDVVMSDTTDQTAMIAVQGPLAMAICKPLFPESVQRLGYYRARVTEQMSKACIVSRTGYTGEDGLELIVRNEDANRVWENLMLAGRASGIQAAGLGARDTLRLEAGMPLYGHELDENINPIFAGLGFAVQTKDRDFIGIDAIERAKKDLNGPARVGLVLDGKRAARQGADVIDSDSRVIGQVTSGSFSPTLQQPIAMAYVHSEMSKSGSSVDVDIRGSKTSARIVDLPFYKRQSL